MAEQGSAQSQFNLYVQSEPSADGLYWLCRAANQGNIYAQEGFGDLHAGTARDTWRDTGFVQQDYIRALMWYRLTAAKGLTTAAWSRDRLAGKMTPEQIAFAFSQARS